MKKRTALHLLALISLITPAAALASPAIPDANLRVAVQQKVEGKINSGFYVLELSCRDGNCSLSTVTLNQCGESGYGLGKQAFNPKVLYSSTSIGNLKVKNEGNSIVIQETGSDMIGEYVNNLRFDYEPTIDGRTVTRLTGFSGSYAKNSPALNKVFRFDYVPLPKATQVMKLDCDAVLPGINKK